MATNQRLVLRIFDSQCRPIRDVPSRIVFRKNGSQAVKQFASTFPGGEATVPIRGNINHAVLDCVLEVPRYVHRSIGFLPFRSRLVERDVWLPRDPSGGWRARFKRWDNLGPEYEGLKKLLRRSRNLHILQKRQLS